MTTTIEVLQDEERAMLQQALLTELESIRLPAIECSFPCKTHPHFQQLKELAVAWLLDRFSHLPSAVSGRGAFTRDFLVRSGYDQLTAMAYASGLPARMPAILKLMAWFFMIDNILDDPWEMGADLAAADELLGGVCEVLDGRAYSGGKSCNNAVMAAMVLTAAEWWEEMRAAGMPSKQQQRMVEKMKEYLDGNRPQIKYRARGPMALPGLEEYIQNRARAGGWQPCGVAIEFVLGIELQKAILEHPLVRALQCSAANHVYWVNDLASFKKEALEGDMINIVPVLYMHHNGQVSLQAIIHEVGRMITACDTECVKLMEQIRSCPELTSPDVDQYLEGVGQWLSGSVYWHLRSARYGVCTTGHIQSNA